ncbi:peamaclein-like [Phalaenopsis equestris]|uniref:peamaclein-like n=1 Tax=Phalaenopsis equestris TaxID=78828 RepID=UPI0009E3D05B|nr:peamaclein-like [Phalaenopsis equestris]
MKLSANKFFSYLLLIIVLLLAPYFQQMASAQAAFCDDKCNTRCSKAGMQDRCLRDCGICCAECKCVPSGTYGNKDECPCYRDKFTGEGRRRRPKCP